MKLPDGTYGTPDPDNPHVMTLWWVHKGKLKTWPKGVRYAPFPPKAPADLKRKDRGEWRTDWYDSVYWPWKDRVTDAIAADLDAARANFAEYVAEQDRPVVPVRVNKREEKRRRDEAVKAAFLHDVRGMSLDTVVAEMRLPQTTVWRRIEEGRLLLAQIQEAIDRISTPAPSPFLVAAELLAEESADGAST
jgi:hypothetical protein